jgi:hypothetical protein
VGGSAHARLKPYTKEKGLPRSLRPLHCDGRHGGDPIAAPALSVAGATRPEVMRSSLRLQAPAMETRRRK